MIVHVQLHEECRFGLLSFRGRGRLIDSISSNGLVFAPPLWFYLFFFHLCFDTVFLFSAWRFWSFWRAHHIIYLAGVGDFPLFYNYGGQWLHSGDYLFRGYFFPSRYLILHHSHDGFLNFQTWQASMAFFFNFFLLAFGGGLKVLFCGVEEELDGESREMRFV